jgi:ABC-type multidrug transport system ATPase subunit
LNLSTAPAAPTTAGVPASRVAIDIRDAAYDYGDRRALDGLSLAVPTGALFGLLGPNGSGKSTLLSLLIGRRQVASGEIRVLGQPLSAALRARMAMVFQESSLDPLMTVDETISLHGRLFGMSRSAIAERAELLLDAVGLSDRRRVMTSTLSGGMKRRLELARALLTTPEVILLDEPTLALDPDSRQRLWQHLLDANAQGCTLLLATNDVHEAERYCNTVALLDAGRIVAQGAPSDLKHDLRREAVRIEWRRDPATEAADIATWDGVGQVRVAGNTTHVTVDAASPFLARLFQHAGAHVQGVQIEESTLEDVYFQLVGKGITADREATGVAPEAE